MTSTRSVSSKGLRFAHLRLSNWRNFVQVSVPLQRRVFLVGANASGKSNLLDSLRFLHDLVALGGGFEEAIARRGGVSKLRCLAARRYSDVEIAVVVSDGGGNPQWTYEISFGQEPRGLRRAVLKREIVKNFDNIILERPNDDDRNDPARLHQSHIEQVNVNKDFRDLADFFSTIRYVHLVPQLVREADRYVGRGDDPYGSDFLEQVARTTERTRNVRLRKIGEALKVAVPQLQQLEFIREGRTPHLRGRYEHWRPRGAWQTEEQFSDGTLRLLGLLWAVLDSSGPLLLEEPELSLHPDVVRSLPLIFYRMQRRTGRQVLVSTHSPDLLRDEGIGLDEVLLLRPRAEGTRVETATNLAQAKALLEGGVPLPDVLLPEIRPPRPEQLALFGD